MSWRIFQRWFNAPPRKDAKFITNKSGEKFWIYWDFQRFERAAELHVSYRGQWIGIVNSLREKDGSITLADIVIFERFKKYRLRDRGLGKAMLQEFIRWAKEHKFKRIWGFIEPHDGSTFEYLEKWYERQGFRVKDGQIFFELDGNTPW